MAAGIMPAPGTTHGPCETECKHRDCAEARFITSCLCRFCDKPIGYDTRFYLDPDAAPATPDDRRWVHAMCIEDAVERERTVEDEHLGERYPMEGEAR